MLPPPRVRSDDTAGRALLIFIDDLHFEPEYTPHVRKLLQTIGDTLVHDGDLVAIVSSGPSYISIGPTYDKKLMMEAVGKIRGSGLICRGDLQVAGNVARAGGRARARPDCVLCGLRHSV